MIGEMIRKGWTMVVKLFVGSPKELETNPPDKAYKNIFASTEGQTAQRKRSSLTTRTTAKKKSSVTTTPPKKRGRPSKKSSTA